MASVKERIKKAWNVFRDKNDDEQTQSTYIGISSSYDPSSTRLKNINERSIMNALFSRIAVDASQIDIKHVKTNNEDQYEKTMDTGLNYCFTVESNKDQTPRMLIRDTVLTMFDYGCVAIVPIETSRDPKKGSFDIYSLRAGRITDWYPNNVKVHLYDDRYGVYKDVLLSKYNTAIIENPFYSVVNSYNSTWQRLSRKLSELDRIDEYIAAGKLNALIQVPYAIKTKARMEQANQRMKEMEDQIRGSKYGVAYIDSTEKFQQLSRPIDNKILEEIKYLTSMLYSQLGMSEDILSGTASADVMTNYYTRTMEPIMSSITEECRRKFLSKTAISQHQSIQYFIDPFKIIPVNKIAEMADTLTRNEIVTSNEFRRILGKTPSTDPRADELHNSNLYPVSDSYNEYYNNYGTEE